MLLSCCKNGMFKATVFGSSRIIVVILFHLTFSAGLVFIYYRFNLDVPHGPGDTITPDFFSGVKDFVDLCVTGIIFLLGGFVTQSLTRWWNIRTVRAARIALESPSDIHSRGTSLYTTCTVTHPLRSIYPASHTLPDDGDTYTLGFHLLSRVMWQNCVGGLWNALCNLSLLSTAMWPTASPEHREARELVARYNLLCFQLLFIEGQACGMLRVCVCDI